VKKLIRTFLVGLVLTVFAVGCGGNASKETKVKCPKCGSTFTVDEGLKALSNQP
jgi:hypothetical protein